MKTVKWWEIMFFSNPQNLEWTLWKPASKSRKIKFYLENVSQPPTHEVGTLTIVKLRNVHGSDFNFGLRTVAL
jgi:hypothetical protein